jgi:hypothetical protein
VTKILRLSPLSANLDVGGEASSIARRVYTLVGGLSGTPNTDEHVAIGTTRMGGLISAELRLTRAAGAG